MNIQTSLMLWLKGTVKGILKSLISSFGIMFLNAFAVLYFSFKDSVTNYIESNVLGKLAINQIKVFSSGSKNNKAFASASIIRGSISKINI